MCQSTFRVLSSSCVLFVDFLVKKGTTKSSSRAGEDSTTICAWKNSSATWLYACPLSQRAKICSKTRHNNQIISKKKHLDESWKRLPTRRPPSIHQTRTHQSPTKTSPSGRLLLTICGPKQSWLPQKEVADHV